MLHSTEHMLIVRWRIDLLAYLLIHVVDYVSGYTMTTQVHKASLFEAIHNAIGNATLL